MWRLLITPKHLWQLGVSTMGILGAMTADANQVGVWIACFFSVVALVVAYRTLTKDFVTKTELKAELSDALEKNRHATRNELNSVKLELQEELKTMQTSQMENARTLGRIEGILLGHPRETKL